jgi:shikimate kinase
VIGTSGSGKSRFARQLAAALKIPYLEMDRLYWKPNWQEPNDEEFFSILEHALSGDAWVLDGNYTRTTHIKWLRANLVVWIDYSFPLTLYRVIKRSILRAWKKQELWPGTGNRESFMRLFSKDSMVLWALSHYASNKGKFEELMATESYAHIEFVRLRSLKEAAALIQNLTNRNQQA